MLKTILSIEDQKEFKRIVPILFGYLFREFDKFEYRRRIGDRQLAKDVWARVRPNGYILKSCKLFAYAVHCNRRLGLSTSPGSYGIMQEDVSILRSLNLSHIPLRFKALNFQQYDKLEDRLITGSELATNIGKFVSKKLIFLDRHFGEKRDEIDAQLTEEALYALRKQYPFYKSELHAQNICKTTARNYGHGLIQYYTRAKRNKLMMENGQFQAVNVPFDAVAVTALSVRPAHEDETHMNLQALASIEERMPRKVRKFLHIASGQYDSGFSLFIGNDNTDSVQDLPYDRYMEHLRSYLDVTAEQTVALFAKLKTAIS